MGQDDDPDALVEARIMAPVTAAEGFPTRAEIVERYARADRLRRRRLDWYQAFSFFKLAVICQGIAARAAGGAMLGSGFDEAQRLVCAARHGRPLPACRAALT